MKKVLFLFAILFALITSISYIRNLPNLPNFSFRKTAKITIDKIVFKLYVAKSAEEKEIGLSKYSKLDQDTGMFFVFDKADYYPFWMKNMQFPIDIIYINKDRIVTIFKNVQPPKDKNENLPIFNSAKPADGVLEINANTSQKYNFKEGELVKIEL